MAETVLVVTRCRPFNQREKNLNALSCLNIDHKRATVAISKPGVKEGSEDDVKDFTYDAAFDMDCTQSEVYETTAFPIVNAALSGFNGTVFCYGQTGTGKTFSMQGIANVPELRGIIPNAFNQVFDHIANSPQTKFLVRASYLEIYNEEILDLLNNDPNAKGLELKEHPDSGVYVKDLSNIVVKNVVELDALMDAGNKNRTVGATLMNATSSRSHSIFTITIESSEMGPDGQEHIMAGKLNLVDLAGSERQAKTGATGDRLKEATKINLSLSALGNVISALVDPKSKHIPYRDSKLTRLLQDSLGGNAKTLMIATLSPADDNYDETLSTLRYAYRAKQIKNKPKINEDPKDAMLREFQEEIKRLKEALEKRGTAEVITKVVKKVVTKKVQKIKPVIKVTKKKKEKVAKANKEKKVHRERTLLPGETPVPGQETTDAESEDDVDDDEEEEEASGALGTISTLEEGQEEGEDGGDVEEVEEVVEEEEEDPAAAERAAMSAMNQAALVEMQNHLAQERESLLKSKELAKGEKQKLLEELERRATEVEEEKKAREEELARLHAMEEKLLVGGGNIVEDIKFQETKLQETKTQVEERFRKERELQQQLESKQEAQLQLEEHYASLQEEVDSKTKKLKKIVAKIKSVKAEVQDIQDEFRKEKEDLLDSLREVTRDLSLRNTIIDHFIPFAEMTKLEKRIVFSETDNEWVLNSAAVRNELSIARPLADPGLRQPTSQFSKVIMANGDMNLRYRGENLLCLKLMLPEAHSFRRELPPNPADEKYDGSLSRAGAESAGGGVKQGGIPASPMSSMNTFSSLNSNVTGASTSSSAGGAFASFGQLPASGGDFPMAKSKIAKPKSRYA